MISAKSFCFSKDNSCLGNQIKLAKLMLASCLEIENSLTYVIGAEIQVKDFKNILLNRKIR